MTPRTDTNELLAAIPQQELDRILAFCEPVSLVRDEILSEPGEAIRHVYFPIDSFVSLLTAVDQHDALAVALVGSEGLVGASLVLGVATSALRGRVQGSGRALRMTAADFLAVLPETPVLERHLRRYLHVLLAQIAQTAACATYHVVEVRLACWLLMAHDRAHSDRFYLTHELLARMLGVRRSGVTSAAGLLQMRHLISYTRGHIVIRDRKGLEHAACACYRTMRHARFHMARASSHNSEAGGARIELPQRRERRSGRRLRAVPLRADAAPVIVPGGVVVN